MVNPHVVISTLLLLIILSVTPSSSNVTYDAAPIDSTCESYRDALSHLIERFLEKLRAHMSTGIPSLGIPPLDPLDIPDQAVSIKKPYQYDLSGSIASSKLEGLHAFNVTSISTSILHMQANISVMIPYVFLTGHYTLKGKALTFIPLKGQGPYTLKPESLDTTITTSLSISHGHIQMTSMDFNIKMAHLFAKFEGLFGGGNFGNLANSLMNRFGATLFRKIEPKIHEKLRVAIMTEVNHLLQEIPLAELITTIPQSHCRSAVQVMIDTMP